MEAGCCGSGDGGVAHMGVEYSTEGQSGCSRGDSSQSVDGRWCGGPDRESSREKSREHSQEHLGLLHQPFWRVLVNDGMRFVSFRQGEVVHQSVSCQKNNQLQVVQFSSVQSLRHVQLCDPVDCSMSDLWSITNSRSVFKLMSIQGISRRREFNAGPWI